MTCAFEIAFSVTVTSLLHSFNPINICCRLSLSGIFRASTYSLTVNTLFICSQFVLERPKRRAYTRAKFALHHFNVSNALSRWIRHLITTCSSPGKTLEPTTFGPIYTVTIRSFHTMIQSSEWPPYINSQFAEQTSSSHSNFLWYSKHWHCVHPIPSHHPCKPRLIGPSAWRFPTNLIQQALLEHPPHIPCSTTDFHRRLDAVDHANFWFVPKGCVSRLSYQTCTEIARCSPLTLTSEK